MPETTRRPGDNPGFEGMDAKKAGLPVSACPYDPGPRRTAWVTGWYIVNNTEAASADV